MKRVEKKLSILISISIILSLLFNSPLIVNADGGTTADNEFNHGVVGYYMIDSTSIPEGVHFYYKYDTGKAWYCNLDQAISLLSNKSYGLSYNLQVLTALANGFMSYAASYTGGGTIGTYAVVTGYNPNETSTPTIVGYALNSIVGCKIVDPSNTNPSAEVDSTVNNFIYNYVNNYIETNYAKPDYINYAPYDADNFQRLLDISSSKYSAWVDFLQGNKTKAIYAGDFDRRYSNYSIYIGSSSSTYYGTWEIGTDNIFYAKEANKYDQLCEYFSLNQKENELKATDIVNYVGSSSFTFEAVKFNKTNNNANMTVTNINSTTFTPNGNTSDMTYFGVCQMYYGSPSHNRFLIMPKGITIFRNSTIATQIINNTYSPTINKSDNYYNYDSNSTTNNITVTENEIDNSTQNNSNIYNDQSQSYTDNSYYSDDDNYYIDNSQVTENNTTIINNYYGDEGGGGGGSGDDDDDDNDFIWDAMLKAIVEFFKKIGELIAALITGILGLFTQVLDALAQISTNFTSLTNFFASILGFLPSEMVAVLTASLGLVLLCCVIRIFRR